jgi:hypothetical protein
MKEWGEKMEPQECFWISFIDTEASWSQVHHNRMLTNESMTKET